VAWCQQQTAVARAIYNCISVKVGRGVTPPIFMLLLIKNSLCLQWQWGVNVRSSRPYSDSEYFSSAFGYSKLEVIWVTDLGQFLGKPTALNMSDQKFRSLPLKIKTRWWVWQLTRCRNGMARCGKVQMLTNVSDSTISGVSGC